MIQRRQWLVSLSRRCASPPDLPQRLDEYARGLADLPPGAFCEASLEAISAEEKFFPPYAAVRTALLAWWEANKPPALGGQSKLSLGSLAAVQAWTNAPPEEQLDRLRVVRRYQSEAFKHLLQTHEGALRLARAQGWLPAAERAAQAAEVPA